MADKYTGGGLMTLISMSEIEEMSREAYARGRRDSLHRCIEIVDSFFPEEEQTFRGTKAIVEHARAILANRIKDAIRKEINSIE
jgi:hypothetical protein